MKGIKRVLSKRAVLAVSAVLLVALAFIVVPKITADASTHVDYSGLDSISNYNPDTDEFVISTKEDMFMFADLVNSGVTFSNQTVHLNNDIDLQCSEDRIWTPVGEKKSFQGTFDGNNYSVSGLYIYKETTNNQGLFGLVKNATIKDLSVYGQVICSKKNDWTGFSGIVAKASGTVTISSCNNYADITLLTSTGTSNDCAGVGGVLGSSDTSKSKITVDNCKNFGVITGNGTTGYVGGIVGRAINCNSLTITNCENNGNVTAYDRMAGIIGSVQNVVSASLENNTNNGSLVCTNYCVSGIASCIEGSNTNISKCINNGNISCQGQYAGGITGQAYSNGTLFIEYCDNNGDIEMTGKHVNTGSAGGLIGINEGAKVTLLNSRNYGDITASYSGGYGGLVGSSTFTKTYNASLTINNCLTEGVITGPGYLVNVVPTRAYVKYGVGGAIGSLATADASLVNINGVTVDAIVNANGYAGGLVGMLFGPAALGIDDPATVTFSNADIQAIVSGHDVLVSGVAETEFDFGVEDRYTIKSVIGCSLANTLINNSTVDVALTETLADGSIYEINYDDSYRKETKAVIRENAVYGVTDEIPFGLNELTDIAEQSMVGSYNKYLSISSDFSDTDVVRSTTLRGMQNSNNKSVELPSIFSWDDDSAVLDINKNYAAHATFGKTGVNIVLLKTVSGEDIELPDVPLVNPDPDNKNTKVDGDSTDKPEEINIPSVPLVNPTPGTTDKDSIVDGESIDIGVVPLASPEGKPNTGDSSNVVMWIAIMAGVVVVLAGAMIFLKKKNSNDNNAE